LGLIIILWHRHWHPAQPIQVALGFTGLVTHPPATLRASQHDVRCEDHLCCRFITPAETGLPVSCCCSDQRGPCAGWLV